MTSRTNQYHSPKRNQKPSLSPNFSDFLALTPNRTKAHSPVPGGKQSPSGGKHSPNGGGGNKTKRENKSLSPKFLRGKLSSIPAPHSPLHHNSSGKLRWNPEPETPFEIFVDCPIDDLKEQEIQILREAGQPHRRQILLNGVAVGFLERHSSHHKTLEGTEAHDSHEGHALEDHSDHSSAASDADCELTNRWTVTNPSGEAVVRIAEKAVHSEDERTLPPHLRQPKHPKALRVYTMRPVYRGQLASSKIPCGLPGKRQHLYHAADLRAKPAGILGNQVARQLRVPDRKSVV